MQVVHDLFIHITQLGFFRASICGLCCIGGIFSLTALVMAFKEVSDIQDYASGGMMHVFQAMILLAVCTVGFVWAWCG